MRAVINSLVVLGTIGAPVVAMADDPPAERAAAKAADAKKDLKGGSAAPSAPDSATPNARDSSTTPGDRASPSAVPADAEQNAGQTGGDQHRKATKSKKHHHIVKPTAKHGNAVDNGQEGLDVHTGVSHERG